MITGPAIKRYTYHSFTKINAATESVIKSNNTLINICHSNFLSFIPLSPKGELKFKLSIKIEPTLNLILSNNNDFLYLSSSFRKTEGFKYHTYLISDTEQFLLIPIPLLPL